MFIFESQFTGIPLNAIPFLIGIWCYGTLAYIKLWVDDQEEDSGERLLAMIIYKIVLVIIVLFSLWRVGIASMIQGKLTAETFTLFLINLGYITLGFALFYSFYKDNEHLDTIIIVFLWGMFLITTYLICTTFEGFIPNDNTLVQVLITFGYFGIPEGIIYKRKKSRKDVLGK